MPQQKVRINFPTEFKFSPIERLAIGREVVQFIRERTAKGKDKDNAQFAKAFKGPYKGKYKKQYATSLDFKNAGKSTSPINLQLSGDMLASIKVLKHESAGGVTIGLEAEDADNGKMEGNRKGTYGKKKQVAPKRDPLGIADEDLIKILKRFEVTPKAQTQTVEAVRDQLVEALSPIAGAKLTKGQLPDLDVSLTLAQLQSIRKAFNRRVEQLDEQIEGSNGK